MVIPPYLKTKILEQLHECHPGMSRMKALARSYRWWPDMDNEVENWVRSCHICEAHQKNTVKAPIHPWEWTNIPWKRIHMDKTSLYLNKMFLIVIDSYSKCLEVIPTSDADTKQIIQKLWMVFTTCRLPEQCVTNNSSPFTSVTLELFAEQWFMQILTSPYHTTSNKLEKMTSKGHIVEG